LQGLSRHRRVSVLPAPAPPDQGLRRARSRRSDVRHGRGRSRRTAALGSDGELRMTAPDRPIFLDIFLQGLTKDYGAGHGVLDLGRKYREYSHGNKQKLALLLAFAPKPALLILDEPTSGLDPLHQQEFYGLVRDARAREATIFISSHVLSEVEHVCDRVGIVR